MIINTKPQITLNFFKSEDRKIVFSHEEKVHVELSSFGFLQAFLTLEEKKKNYELYTKPLVAITYLVVDDGIVVSTHSKELEIDFNIIGFNKALDELLDLKQSLDQVNILMRTGKLISLVNVQAATLGVQSQYQFPTTVGSSGQVIAYQGVSQLAWINNIGFQGSQGNQGNQGFVGFQGSQGNQGVQGSQGAQGVQGNQGNQGVQGNQGAQGSQGNQGVTNSGFFVPFSFNTNTTLLVASGEVEFNNATISSVSNIDVSKTDKNGAGCQGVLDQIGNGTLILFTSNAGTSQYSFFKITGVTKNSNDYNFSVNYISSVGSLFSNAANISMNVALLGSQGTQGRQGNQGSQGSQGNQGAQGNQGNQGSAISGGQGSTTYTVGSGTFTVPSGVTSLQVELWGGGGAGGNGDTGGSNVDGGGGGGGGYLKKNSLTVTGAQTIAYVVASSAVGNVQGTAGTGPDGNQSSVASIYYANGGKGGQSNGVIAAAAAGGTTSGNGDVNTNGSPGIQYRGSAGGTGTQGTAGGQGANGGVGGLGGVASTVAPSGTAPGGGGGGGGKRGDGGTGAAGQVTFTW